MGVEGVILRAYDSISLSFDVYSMTSFHVFSRTSFLERGPAGTSFFGGAHVLFGQPSGSHATWHSSATEGDGHREDGSTFPPASRHLSPASLLSLIPSYIEQHVAVDQDQLTAALEVPPNVDSKTRQARSPWDLCFLRSATRMDALMPF